MTSNNEVKIIDFSEGIRAGEIQHNFEVVINQLERERISVAGSGIAHGLDFSLNDFTLTISQGTLIDIDGKEIFFDETVKSISLPKLITTTEYKLTVSKDNKVTLSEIPYAITRRTTSEFASLSDSGIIMTFNGTTTVIPVATIVDNVLYLGEASKAGKLVTVKYNYSYKRIDTVYIDENYEIKIAEGVTSSSPSAYIPAKYKYILGFILIDALHMNSKNEKVAFASVKKDFDSVRNLYTDSNNELYICGVPFKDLQIVHMIEPKDPAENTLWYDIASNKLKVWRSINNYKFSGEETYTSENPTAKKIFNTIISYKPDKGEIEVFVGTRKLLPTEFVEGSDLTSDQKAEKDAVSNQFEVLINIAKMTNVSYKITRADGYFEWVNVNDTSYIPVQERKIWSDEKLEELKNNAEHNYRIFLFHKTDDLNLLYTPGKNQLEVIIDQIPLHSDQFEEITLADAVAGTDSIEIKKLLKTYYGYTDTQINSYHEDYENIGIGFKLSKPLDRASYVEVRVEHRVNENPLRKRFQRTATFVSTSSSEYLSGNVQKFKTNIPYSYNEEQLEVFLDGKKLDKGIHFLEGSDITGEKVKGAKTQEFQITIPLSDKQRVSYKISRNIFSYDHVEQILQGIQEDINKAITTSNAVSAQVTEFVNTTSASLNTMNTEVQKLQTKVSESDSTYMRKDAVLDFKNLNSSVLLGLAKGLINTTIQKTSNLIMLSGIHPEDFVLMFDINGSGGNTILIRGEHYEIEKDSVSEKIYLRFINTGIVPTGHTLYITGIKFVNS